jgi:uncharacterized protein YcgI (DUF1989 family)
MHGDLHPLGEDSVVATHDKYTSHHHLNYDLPVEVGHNRELGLCAPWSHPGQLVKKKERIFTIVGSELVI